MGTDTACSSSLLAGHQAYRGLQDGEASSSIAAGVNAMLSPLTTIAICQLQACFILGCTLCITLSIVVVYLILRVHGKLFRYMQIVVFEDALAGIVTFWALQNV